MTLMFGIGPVILDFAPLLEGGFDERLLDGKSSPLVMEGSGCI